MQAFVLTKYGDPLQLRDMPEPQLGSQDVLVRIEASSVNQIDEKIRTGEFKQILPYALPQTLGHDLAGEVIRVGSSVTKFVAGDKVYSSPSQAQLGSFTSLIAIDEADLAHRPSNVTAAEAGSLPLVALTAWQALVERGQVKPGQKVLIHAGAGGVGSIAIQLAKQLGATVATTASASNLEFVRGLGADVAIDYRNEDFESMLSDYDFVLDSLGGENLEKSLRILRPGGKVVGISGPPDPAFARTAGLGLIMRLAIAGLSRKIRKLASRLGVQYEFLFMHPSGEQLAQITALVENGALRPVLASTFPFEKTPEALETLQAGGFRGKVVVLSA